MATCNATTPNINTTEPYDDLIVLCAAGSLQVIIHGNQVLQLNSEEFLHLHAPTGVTHLIPDAPQTVYVVASLRLAEGE